MAHPRSCSLDVTRRTAWPSFTGWCTPRRQSSPISSLVSDPRRGDSFEARLELCRNRGPLPIRILNRRPVEHELSDANGFIAAGVLFERIERRERIGIGAQRQYRTLDGGPVAPHIGADVIQPVGELAGP